MYLYLIFTICLFLAFCQILFTKVKNIPTFYHDFYWIMIVVFISLSTFRWENGTDWFTYLEYFKSLSIPTNKGYMEPAFTLLTSFNSQYTNYTIQLFCVAVFSIFPIGIRIYKLSPYPLVSLFVFFCITLANIFPVRQSIAIAIFVFSWKYIINKNLKKYLLCTILAILFHYSAIITLPIYCLWHRRISTKTLLISIGVIAGLSFFGISNFLLPNNSLFAEIINNYIRQGDQTFGSLYSKDQILLKGIINRSLIFLVSIIFLNRFRSENQIINGSIIMYWYSFMVFLLVTPISVALGRFTTYTDMSQLLLIPFLFNVKMKKSSKVIIAGILLLYFLIRFNGVVNNYYDLYIPYNFVFLR